MKKVLQSIKRLIEILFDIEIYKKKKANNLGRTMDNVLQHLNDRNFMPNTIIDVGVAYGTYPLYNHFPSARILLVEPLEEYKHVLDDIKSKYKAEYVQGAAGTQAKNIEFNVHPDLSGSSMYKETEGSHVDGVLRSINMYRVDALVRERSLKGPILLKIDVQGGELDVLEGAKDILNDIEVILLEVSMFNFFIKGPQFYDIVTYMHDIGFCAYDIFSFQFRPIDRSLGQIDMVFVKENGIFRKEHIWSTREQRKEATQRRIKNLNPKF